MKTELIRSDDNGIVISVKGKVSSDNSEQFRTQTSELRASHPEGDMILDFDELEYISSAGLRVMLSFSKKEKDRLKVINASRDVMDIFDVTGFSKMIDITRKMKEISVEGCALMGKGANGEVYRLDDERIVKVFAETATLDVIKRERDLAQNSMQYGIPTAIAFDVVKCGSRYGAVFELLNAKTMSSVIKEDPSQFDRYAKKYVELYRSLHETEVSPGDFPSIKGIYHDYIDECTDWYTPGQTDLLRRIVDSIPDRNTLIHGDFHANNIMVENGELMLIDMGDVSCGHPIFDFLSTASTQVNLVKLDPAFAEIHTNMPVDRITALWRYLIDNYFADKPDAEKARIEEQAALFSKLKVAMAPAVAKGLDPAIMKASVDDAAANFLSLSDKLIGCIDW